MMRVLREGIEHGDLARLVHDELHVDEYKSKMGDDRDMVVLSFKVTSKAPATDLVNFIEKGYDWIVDADVSSGEMADGDYIVFVEMERNKNVPAQIVELIGDVTNLTSVKLEDYRVRYGRDREDHDVTEQDLASIIPLTPEDYDQKFKESKPDDQGDDDLDQLKSAAGLKITTMAPKNDFTESLRVAAGLK